jgi:Spy/CpxP family protein refolding chaperone
MAGPRGTALLVLAAVFLVGLAAGAVVEEAVDDVRWPFAGRNDGAHQPSDDPLDDDAEEDFLERLGLRPEQYTAVEKALDARQDRLERYWRDKMPDLRAIIDSSRAEIRLLLTPEQQAAYDRWVTDLNGTSVPQP